MYRLIITLSSIILAAASALGQYPGMYDSVVLRANARGENLKYEWQLAKGSLVQDKEDPSKAYFWGCYTCVGRLTVSCTVSNEFGSYTKEIDVFVWPWTKERGRWRGWERYIDRHGQW